MIIHRLRGIVQSPTALIVGVGLGVWLLAARPLSALNDSQQILLGGNSTTESSTRYSFPGMGNQFADNFLGDGMSAASVRLPAGSLRSLRVNVTTQSAPDSGTITVTVMKNGVATSLACSTSGTGSCQRSRQIHFQANDTLVVEAANNFVNSGTIAYTYSLVYD